jgi:hypothetical protein
MDNTLNFTVHSDEIDFKEFEAFVKQNPSELEPAFIETKVEKEGKGVNDILHFISENALASGLAATYLVRLIDWVFTKTKKPLCTPSALFLLKDQQEIQITLGMPMEVITEKLKGCLSVGIQSLSFSID